MRASTQGKVSPRSNIRCNASLSISPLIYCMQKKSLANYCSFQAAQEGKQWISSSFQLFNENVRNKTTVCAQWNCFFRSWRGPESCCAIIYSSLRRRAEESRSREDTFGDIAMPLRGRTLVLLAAWLAAGGTVVAAEEELDYQRTCINGKNYW